MEPGRDKAEPCLARKSPGKTLPFPAQRRYLRRTQNPTRPFMSTTRDIAILVGSLRKESLNRRTAHALIELAPSELKLEIVEIGQLPLYNQDLETNPPA